MEPKRLQALNETTFLATFAVGILAEETGIAIEKVDNWLGKPVVITCDEVTAVQLPHVLECTQHISRADLVVFNPKTDDLHSDSLQTIPSEPHSLMTSPAPLKTVGQPLLNTIPGILNSQVLKEKKILFSLNSGIMLFWMPIEILANPW